MKFYRKKQISLANASISVIISLWMRVGVVFSDFRDINYKIQ